MSELQKISEQWYQAWLDKDAATVDRLMSEDYLFVAPSGRMMDRAAVLAVIRSPSYRLDSARQSELVVRPLGEDAALVRHRFQGAGSYEGTPFTEDNRNAMLWQKQAGHWRLVFEQCSYNKE
jgi:ketosteroid isomerase-like protein